MEIFLKLIYLGTNPDTPIFPKDINIDEYVELLLDYEKFINYYKSNRVTKGKDEYSRTRIGMTLSLIL